MAHFSSKYGVARHIYINIPKAGSANHAVNADWTPAAGDVKISKDGGAAANVTNLPTAIAMGNSAIWDFSLTATEMEAAQVNITVSDSATKAVDDTGFIIETYGHASAQHAFDLDTAKPAVDVDTIKTQAVTCTAGVTVYAHVGTAAADTAQTGDSFAIVNHGSYGNAQLVRSTTPANTLAINASGYVTTTQSYPANFSSMAISVGGAVTVGTNNDKTGYALTAAYDPAKTAAQAGDAMALTGGERTTLAGVVATTQFTESYRADGAAPTLAQGICELLAHHGEASNSGTTKTIKKFDGTTIAATYTYDSGTTPTSITRAT